MGTPSTQRRSVREADKPRLIQEAEALAHELASEKVPRVGKYSNSTDAEGITRSHIALFLGFLQSTRDLGKLRTLLRSAEDIDRAKSMNYGNPAAHHSTLAKILLDELKQNPKRSVDAWIWLFGWTARLLHTARLEQKRRAKDPVRKAARNQPRKPQHRGHTDHKGGFNQMAQLKDLFQK